MPKEPDRTPRKVLGKGLSALLPARQSASAPAATEPEAPPAFGKLQTIPLDRIQPNEEQPRTSFDTGRLEELAHSLRTNGLLQPITVHEIAPGRYRIIAGERRWRAAQLAEFTEIPALVRSVEQHEILELALIENIQREDLNPIEIALAFQSLAENHGLQHDQIAARIGKDRSTITNFLRLLRLSRHVQQALGDGRISAGHARALLTLPDDIWQEQICERIISDQLSVRGTEQLVKEINKRNPTPSANGELVPKHVPEPVPLDANIRAALDTMAMSLGTKVSLYAKTPTSGRLEIEYYSQEDLDRIYSVITNK